MSMKRVQCIVKAESQHQAEEMCRSRVPFAFNPELEISEMKPYHQWAVSFRCAWGFDPAHNLNLWFVEDVGATNESADSSQFPYGSLLHWMILGEDTMVPFSEGDVVYPSGTLLGEEGEVVWGYVTAVGPDHITVRWHSDQRGIFDSTEEPSDVNPSRFNKHLNHEGTIA